VPPSLRIISEYDYYGFGWNAWAYHFTMSPDDLPGILERYPYQHETNEDGFDVERFTRLGQGFIAPPADYKAVHKYFCDRGRSPVADHVTIYADEARQRFLIYSMCE
jgi:hypothetical protein